MSNIGADNRRFDAEPLFGKAIDRWRRWYAWRPVWTLNGGWVWLRPVEFRACVLTVDVIGQGEIFLQYRLAEGRA